MGQIIPTELANGNVGLEITYGGRESPFGGVDTSAPPAYIDSKCFTNCDGFVVVDNKLVAVALNPIEMPPLWSGTAGVILIGFGNFYNSTWGTLNYALGYKAVAIPAGEGTPSGVEYTFYMTAWVPGNPATYWNDTLNYTLYNSLTPATKASLTTNLNSTSSVTPGSGAVINITAVTNIGVNSDGIFYLPGIVSSVSINTAGINYTAGVVYWLEQGTNVTAQILVTSVNGSGGITGASVVPDTYTYTGLVGGVGDVVPISVAGWNYSVGTATPVYAQASNVVLQIAGPGGSNTYTIQSNGVTPVVPTLPGTGAILEVVTAYKNGHTINLFTQSPRIAFTDISIFGLMLNRVITSPGGVNYSVGQVYNLATAYFTTGGVGWDFTPVNTIDSGVQVRITGVGVGGSITDFQLIGVGLEDSSLLAPVLGTPYCVALTTPVAILTVTTDPEIILNDLAAAINTGGTNSANGLADANVTAAINISASSLTLTADIPGTIGNSITAQDFSTISGPNLRYYYFPIRTATHLTGGTDGTSSSTVLSTTLPDKASIASVGGTLYIGNIGPAIIKYSGPDLFAVSTTLQGVRVLKKFAGSLIGLGLIPAPGVVVQATDMIFAWSAALNLDIWAPLGLDGNVTGAGFAQLADIGDYLTGLVVTNGTAFILRSQGVSYAMATGNATSPFNFAHISLGDEGEGAQITALITQYDQTGAFVGNTDVYQIAGGISSIGSKIKMALLNALTNNFSRLVGSAACTMMLVEEASLFLFAVGNVIYVCNLSNGTWQTVTLTLSADALYYLDLGVFASSNTSAAANFFSHCMPVVVIELTPGTYVFYALEEGVPNLLSLSKAPSVSFPVEEIAFGRDITVDALYAALTANVSEDVPVNYSINGDVFSTQTLTSAVYDSLADVPTESQVFASSTSTIGAITAHSPQLQIDIPTLPDTGYAQVRLTKIAEFASYDPKQRPV